MKFRVVTSFSPEGYQLYGKIFLEAYRKYWKTPLTVYYEGGTLPWRTFGRNSKGYNLYDDPECVEFLKHAPPDGKDYRFCVNRFARKVFAITNPQNFDCDYLIWLDADTITKKRVTKKFLDSICPELRVASYLGRTEWHHSECGFVVYNLKYSGKEFLAVFREIYTSGKIYDYLEWHDSYIFDRVREGFGKHPPPFRNLSPNAKGLDAWGASPLADYMVHHKGPQAKKENYT